MRLTSSLPIRPLGNPDNAASGFGSSSAIASRAIVSPAEDKIVSLTKVRRVISLRIIPPAAGYTTKPNCRSNGCGFVHDWQVNPLWEPCFALFAECLPFLARGTWIISFAKPVALQGIITYTPSSVSPVAIDADNWDFHKQNDRDLIVDRRYARLHRFSPSR